MNFLPVILAGLLTCCPVVAQTAAAPDPSTAEPVAALQAAIPQIVQSLDATRPQRWKVKGEDRDTVERNVISVHHDLDAVLPALVTAAQSSPRSIAAGLAVYRNINALYDVLVRLQQTAQLSGREDAAPLQDALTRLEAARGALAESLATLAASQETTLAQAKTLLAAQPQKNATAPKHIVADDGGTSHKKAANKKTTKPAPQTASQ